MNCLSDPRVAIIGAGPYGLSVAAHLKAYGIEFRIFGFPMHQWKAHMPRGMFLKSEGFASNLFDPEERYTLKQYCFEQGLDYAHSGAPIRRDVFTEYGLSFQRRCVPAVENTLVTALGKTPGSFQLQLASGETLTAGIVVVATGMCYSAYIPPELAGLPGDLLSHSGDHHDVDCFKGRDVTIIGAGQSALETAALLSEAQATVRVAARRPQIAWNHPPLAVRRGFYDRYRRPMSALGPGLGPWLYSNAPMLFCRLPEKLRISRVRNALGPAGAWWLRDRVVHQVPVLLDHSLQAAENCRGRVTLHLQQSDGTLRRITTDHVIAATGYRFAARALPFLSNALASQLRCVHQQPVLSANFESSASGLYFTGLASANQFGPAMRFLHGAGFTARRIARHIAGRTH